MYSNIQTCRFYVNTLSWLHASGLVTGGSLLTSNQFLLNPTNQQNWAGRTAEYLATDNGHGVSQNKTNVIFIADNKTGEGIPLSDIFVNDSAYVAILGHNFKSANAQLKLQEILNSGEYEQIQFNNNVVINSEGLYPASFNYDGFSIRSINEAYINADSAAFSFRLDSISGLPFPQTPKVGSVVMGNYFTMPSVDIQQNEGRHMDGVTKVRTPGGTDLYEHKYLRSRNWGNLAPWELHDPANVKTNQTLAKVGRRSWSLSWSAVMGDKLIAPTEELETAIQDTDDYTEGVDYIYSAGNRWIPSKRFNSNSDFYTQVVNRSYLQHPMIFQPDINDETNFAIVKIVSDSINYQSVGYNTYRLKLDLAEVW